MIKHIVWKEFHETIRDGRFLWTCAIVAVLLLASLLMGWTRYEEAKALRDSAASETRKQWLEQGVKNPHASAHYGIYAFKPATPLSLVDPGINDYAGTLTLLEAHKQNEFKYKEAQDATALQRFGDLSAAMILQLLIPLLIILLTFSSIAGEREDGTLRQVLSVGVKQSTLVWGKALGVALTLGVTLLPAVLIGAFVISLFSSADAIDAHAMVDMPAKLAVLTVAYLVYFAIFVGLSLIVSILASSSRTALTLLLGFWIFNGLLFPRAASDISRQVYRTPSASEFAKSVIEGKLQGPMPHNPSHPNFIAFRKGVLEKYGVARIEDLPVNFYGLALQADEEHGYKLYDRLFGELWKQFRQQDRLKQSLGVISPYLAIHSVSMGLAGTDFALHRDFAAAAEQYRRDLQLVMNRDIQEGAAGKSIYIADWQYTAGANLWAKVPPFDYDPPPFAEILRQQSLPLSVLFGWLVVVVFALRFAPRRMRVDA